MAKGQISLLVLVLVVVGAVIYFAYPTLIGVLSGSGSVTPIQINNDVLTINSYSVSSLELYPGDFTTISFIVQNNGDHEIMTTQDVINNNDQIPTIDFYDLGGMTFHSLQCGNSAPFTDPTEHQCQFDLKPFESEKISLTLQAPSIISLTTFQVSYSINYSYSGTRTAVIPIVDGVTRTTPLGKFLQSQASYAPNPNTPASYGPLQLSYSFPSTGTTEVNNNVITQEWGINNQPFRLQLHLSNMGTVAGAQPIKLYSIFIDGYSNNLKLGDSNEFCPIDSKLITSLMANNQNAISSQPLTLNCQFTADIGTTPETTAQVTTNFYYDYTIIRTALFTVQPFQQKT